MQTNLNNNNDNINRVIDFSIKNFVMKYFITVYISLQFGFEFKFVKEIKQYNNFTLIII